MQIRWKHFRGFEDTGWIDLKPLTVLIGPNNTGKSSLYAPLLLLKQTIEARLADPGLVTRGEYLDGGAYRDIVTDHDESHTIEFWFRISDEEAPGLIDRPGAIDEEVAATPRELRLAFKPVERDIALAAYLVLDASGKTLLARSLRSTGKYSIRGTFWDRVKQSKDAAPRGSPLRNWITTTEAARPVNFLFGAVDPIRFVVRSIASDSPIAPDPDVVVEVFTFMAQLNALLEGVGYVVRNVLNSANYLGPLRAEPQRWYEISGERPTSVGVRGEDAPEVLFRAPRGKFRDEVAEWLERFGFGSRLVFHESGDAEVFALLLESRTGGPLVNLADSGFGASQILPIVVEAVNAKKGRLLIVEQPEIHLNPRLQAQLGELFALVPGTQGTVIVETHSEHLLMRIRTLLARGDLAAEDVAVYFTERVGARSTVRRVEISGDGQINPDEWPRDFFAESVSQALALASAQAGRRHG